MNSRLQKIIISTSITLSLIAGPVILPLQVSAGNDYLNYDNPNKGGTNPYKISLQGVVSSGMLMNVVGCTGVVNSISKVSTQFIQDLFLRKADRLARRAAKKTADAADKIVDSAQKIVTATAVAAPGVPAADVGSRTQKVAENVSDTAHKLAKSAKELITDDEIDAALKRNEDKLRQANFREECLNGIAVTLAKNQLSAMTKYTMNWVNSGFNGDPLFVRNVDSLMYSIENSILEEQTRWFKDPENVRAYPYGRDFAISAINAKQSSDNFLDSMKSDLSNYLTPGATTESFANDFSEGGWSGWFALTQRSQNNPLGFMIEQSENLTEKQTTATQNTKEELARNGGVLDQKKCVEWEKPKTAATRNQLTSGTSPAGSFTFTMVNGNLVRTPVTTQANSTATQPKCIRYEAVTPGSVIKTKIDTYINSPERQLELARTINDALNALFSALIYKFQNQGLSSLSSSVNNYSGTATAGFGVNQVLDSNGNSILVQNGGGTGSSGTGDGYIDLTRDLGNTYTNGQITKKGIIQIEHDYIKAAKESVLVLEKVTPAIGKLDYCIPGPNPNWKAVSLDAIDAYLDTIDGSTAPAIDPSIIESQLASYETEVEALYGANSPMQTFASGSYLGMANEGLAITKDLVTTAETITEARDEYRDTITEGNANMTKLNTIKDKVNVIIVAAQRRRTEERATLGLPAMNASCLANEKVTYLDNGVRR